MCAVQKSIPDACLRLAAVALAALPLHSDAGPTACQQPQRSLFSCSTGTKMIAVCASPNLMVRAGSLQYRFGRPAALEWSYPPRGAEWRSVTRGGTMMYSGGGAAFLAFTRSEYRYIVYAAVGSGWGTKAGVAVEKNGKRIANISCKDSPASEIGPDLFSEAGIELIDDGFELP